MAEVQEVQPKQQQGELVAYQDERSISDDETLVRLVNARFDISKTYRQGFDDRFDRMYRYYRSYVDYDPEYWYRYQLFLPYIFGIIESITPDFVEALIGGDEFFNIRSSQGNTKSKQNMETLMRYQIDERMDFYRKILHGIKSKLIFGNSITFVGWNKESRTFTKKEWIVNQLLGLAASVRTKKTENIRNDPFIDTVFIKNFYPHPFKESIKDMSWCIERAFVDWDYILKLKGKDVQLGEGRGVYQNLDKIKETNPPDEFKSVMEEMNTLVGISSSANPDPINKPVELLKYWTPWGFVIVANRSVCIRKGPNPFDHQSIPYVEDKNYPLDKEFYAISDVDLLIPLQDVANDMTNLRLDNLTDIINSSYIIDRGANVNPDDVIAGPSRIIWSDDKLGVVPIKKEPIPAAAYTEPEAMYKTMQRATGAWEYMQGATPEHKETATGIIRLQQAALKRFGYRIKLSQKTSFKEILTLIMQLNQQLLPIGYTTDVFGEDMPIRLNPWDIAGKMSVQVTGSSNMVGLAERIMMVWREAKGDPYFDQAELRKRMIDILDLPNGDKLINQASSLLGAVQNMAKGGRMGILPELIKKVQRTPSGVSQQV